MELKLSKCFYVFRFDRLMSLYLNSGSITTFEFLSFIDAPKLINLVLKYNKATTMKSFNKQVISKLGLLDVEKNPLNEIGI